MTDSLDEPACADVVGEPLRRWWIRCLVRSRRARIWVLAFAWLGITLCVLILFVGAYAIVDGVLAHYSAICEIRPTLLPWGSRNQIALSRGLATSHGKFT